MKATAWYRGAGALALVSAGLSVLTWAALTLLGPSPTSDVTGPASAWALRSLAFFFFSVGIPAVGGTWLLWGGHQRGEVGAGLVAAAGMLVTAAIPGTLVTATKLPAEWQLPAVTAPMVLALAGGLAAASLIRSARVGWSSPLCRRAAPARALILASSVVIAFTMQPLLTESARLAATDGLSAGVSHLVALPSSVWILVLLGFGATLLIGVAAAGLRPPRVAAAGAVVLAAQALGHTAGALTPPYELAATFWLHGAGVLLLLVATRALVKGRATPARQLAIAPPPQPVWGVLPNQTAH